LQRLDIVGLTRECITRVGDPSDEVPAVATSIDADFVILGAHQAYLGQNPLGGVVADVIAAARCDVGVFIRPESAPVVDARVAVFFAGGLSDLGVLEASAGLARGADVPLRVLHPVHAAVPELSVPVESIAIEEPTGASIASAADGARVIVVGVPSDGRNGSRVQLIEQTGAPVLVVAAKHVAPVTEQPPISTRRKVSVNVSGEQSDGS
jgi:hypothetical protein